MKKIKVIIIQRIVPHYRVDLYNLLSSKLNDLNIELKIIYGNEDFDSITETISEEFDWSLKIKNNYFNIFKREFIWQSLSEHIKGADLIVLENSNRLIANYLLLIKRKFSSDFKIAFWGHGSNLQLEKNYDYLERWKKFYSNQVDWWFTYTQSCTLRVSRFGFPRESITTLNNAIDTISLQHEFNDSRVRCTVDRLRVELGITGTNVGIFCGRMYPAKNIPFLLKACLMIRDRVNDFQMLFIGNGSDADMVKNICKEFDWIHYLGKVTGIDRVPYFMLSSVFLMPGLVGLAILDSFALETPIVTTNYPYHSPEIDYLVQGNNGIITNYDIEIYAETVIKLLEDKDKIKKLKIGCRVSSFQFSLENMVNNFSNGIVNALKK